MNSSDLLITNANVKHYMGDSYESTLPCEIKIKNKEGFLQEEVVKTIIELVTSIFAQRDEKHFYWSLSPIQQIPQLHPEALAKAYYEELQHQIKENNVNVVLIKNSEPSDGEDGVGGPYEFAEARVDDTPFKKTKVKVKSASELAFEEFQRMIETLILKTQEEESKVELSQRAYAY